MEFLSVLFITIGSIHSAKAFEVPTTNNPVKYAEEASLLYAQGDTGDTSGRTL